MAQLQKGASRSVRSVPEIQGLQMASECFKEDGIRAEVKGQQNLGTKRISKVIGQPQETQLNHHTSLLIKLIMIYFELKFEKVGMNLVLSLMGEQGGNWL